MDRCELLLKLLLEYINLSDLNDDAHNREDLVGYDNSELNCLDCIGRMENPNVTSIAAKMGMTKGAISKITKKLLDKEAIETYQLGDNRQKVFYKLTEKGRALFAAHEERHRQWQDRELSFLHTISEEDREAVIRFMLAYNANLNERIAKIVRT